MKANDWLVAKASSDKKSILIFTRSAAKISVLGSSVTASVHSPLGVDSFTVAPEKPGLIALRISSFEFFIPVNVDETGAHVELETPWVPRSDRLGQIVNDEVHVIIDGVIYTSKEFSRSGYREVPNGGDLICQYLNGDVDANTVKEAAEHSEGSQGDHQQKNTQRHNPLKELWSDPIACLRKNLSLSRLRGFGESGLAGLYAVALAVVIALCAGMLIWGPVLWAICAISGGVLGMGVTMRLWGWKPVFFTALGLAASKTLSVLYYNHTYHWSPFDVPDMILGPILFFGCGLVAMLYCRHLPTNYQR